MEMNSSPTSASTSLSDCEYLHFWGLSFSSWSMAGELNPCDFSGLSLQDFTQKMGVGPLAKFPAPCHPITLLSLHLCVRQEVSGKASRWPSVQSGATPQKGKPRQGSQHTVTLAQTARPVWGCSGLASSCHHHHPHTSRLFRVEKRAEQGLSFQFCREGKKKRDQETCQDQSEVT